MKAQVLQTNLARSLSICTRFVSLRAQLPILSNVVFVGKKNKLSILATNLEMSIADSIGASIEEEGSVSIPAKVIHDLIANLPKNTLEIETKGEQMSISAPNFSSVLMGMNPLDFPAIPQELNKEADNISQKEFVKGLNQVLFATSSDETRPVLTGVLFIIKSGHLYLVSTDGFRLSHKEIPLGSDIKDAKYILPKSFLGELSRITTDASEISLSTKLNENQVVFGVGDTVLSTRVIEGEFPNYERIIPKDKTVSALVDKQDFMQAVKTALVIARESAYVGKISIEKEGITISSESQKSGTQKISVEGKVEGQNLEILYNLHFLEEAIQNLVGESLYMEFKDNSAPGLFRNPTDPTFFHLIMPVKM